MSVFRHHLGRCDDAGAMIRFPSDERVHRHLAGRDRRRGGRAVNASAGTGLTADHGSRITDHGASVRVCAAAASTAAVENGIGTVSPRTQSSVWSA